MKQAAFFIFVLLVSTIGATLWYFWNDFQTQLYSPVNLDSEITFTIKPGMNLNQVADNLEQKKLISEPHYLMLEAISMKKLRQVNI